MNMSPPDWLRLGTYVRERRTELGLTQEEIATRGGPSTATLRLIEGGKGPFRAKSLRQLADALHWTPESPRAITAGREPAEVLELHQDSGAAINGHAVRPLASVSTEPEPEPPPAEVSISLDAVRAIVGPALVDTATSIRRHAETVLARNWRATGDDIFPGEPDLAELWDLAPSLPVPERSRYAAIMRLGRQQRKSG